MLDVSLRDPALGSSSGEPSFFFEDDDARYWFLYPFFESVYERTHQMVDLYGQATFRGEPRKVLLQYLALAERTALQQPDRWLICTGRRSNGNEPGPVFVELRRSELLNLIRQLQTLVEQAIESDKDVCFDGD